MPGSKGQVRVAFRLAIRPAQKLLHAFPFEGRPLSPIPIIRRGVDDGWRNVYGGELEVRPPAYCLLR